jgi:imidazole glycerol-phosphate synthase subunit HisH
VIFLIDYKAGNLASVRKALGAVGVTVAVPAHPDELLNASGIIVPGVGHFGSTLAIDAHWTDAILDRVSCGRPLLGICLGMQWLFESSTEAPELKGLGIMGGTCERLGAAADPVPVKVPHVGWNSLDVQRDSWISEGVATGAQVYFTHSYAAPVTADAVATAEHGQRFSAIVERGCVAGVQFHPEKSGDVGLQVLRNFVRFCA